MFVSTQEIRQEYKVCEFIGTMLFTQEYKLFFPVP